MSAFDETLLRARFEALGPEPMQPDWLDVRRRVRDRRRTLVLAALAAAFAVVLVGCTAVFGPRIVRFADSEQSPAEVIEWVALVGRANAVTDPGAPGFDPQQTRHLLDGPFRGGTLAIDLTPAEGGFCVSLTYALQMSDGTTTDCVGAVRRRAQPVTVIEPDGRAARDETITDEVREQGATSLVGWTTLPEATHAVVRFEGVTVREVDRFLRVTAPIDAAFFTAEIPDELTHFPRRAVELVVLDADGDEIGRQAIANADPDEWTFPRFGRENGGFPPAADGAKSVLLRFPGTDATVSVAPARGGATCFRFDVPGAGGSESCLRDAESRAPARLDSDAFFPGPGAGPQHPVVLWGTVAPTVRRVELTFQDGAGATLTPQRGFVVYAIPPGHHEPGTRLVGARLLDADGRLVRGIAFDPTTRDLYPCADPVDPGLGPPVCP